MRIQEAFYSVNVSMQSFYSELLFIIYSVPVADIRGGGGGGARGGSTCKNNGTKYHNLRCLGASGHGNTPIYKHIKLLSHYSN